MSIKYWEFEDAPFKEKIKSPRIGDISRLFFDNETEAYRFSLLLLAIKKGGKVRLKDMPKEVPIATAKRYLEYAVRLGLVKHESSYYELTDRYTQPFRNIALYIKAWMSDNSEEDLLQQFATAKMEKQDKRGGRTGQNEKDIGDNKEEE